MSRVRLTEALLVLVLTAPARAAELGMEQLPSILLGIHPPSELLSHTQASHEQIRDLLIEALQHPNEVPGLLPEQRATFRDRALVEYGNIMHGDDRSDEAIEFARSLMQSPVAAAPSAIAYLRFLSNVGTLSAALEASERLDSEAFEDAAFAFEVVDHLVASGVAPERPSASELESLSKISHSLAAFAKKHRSEADLSEMVERALKLSLSLPDSEKPAQHGTLPTTMHAENKAKPAPERGPAETTHIERSRRPGLILIGLLVIGLVWLVRARFKKP